MREKGWHSENEMKGEFAVALLPFPNYTSDVAGACFWFSFPLRSTKSPWKWFLLVLRAVVFVCGLEFFSTRAFLYISIIIVNIFVYAEGFSMILPLDFLLPVWLRRLSTFIPEALSTET